MRLPFKNQTIFAGYVGNEPELRQLASGDATLSLRIVTKHSWQVEGEWKTIDEWATAVFYRVLAQQVIESGIKKGSFVHVEGRRHTRPWSDANGRPKKSHEIIVSDWHEVTLPAGARATAAVAQPPHPDPPSPSGKPAAPAAPKPRRAPTAPPTTATGGFA